MTTTMAQKIPYRNVADPEEWIGWLAFKITRQQQYDRIKTKNKGNKTGQMKKIVDDFS